MRIALLILIIVCCAAVAGQAVWLRAATESTETFTKYHDPERAEQEQSGGSVGDLFEGTGIDDAAGGLEEVPNRFRLGVLPASPDRHFLSVLSFAGPAALAALAAVGLFLLRPKRAGDRANAAGAPASNA